MAHVSQYYGMLACTVNVKGIRRSGLSVIAATHNGAIRISIAHDTKIQADWYKVEEIIWKKRGKNRLIEEGIINVKEGAEKGKETFF